MSGHSKRSGGAENGRDWAPLGPLDDDSIERIDAHLERALEAGDADEADFHVRHARQLLEACRRD